METHDPTASLRQRRRLIAGIGGTILLILVGVALWPDNPTAPSSGVGPGSPREGSPNPAGNPSSSLKPGDSSQGISAPASPTATGDDGLPFSRSPHYPQALEVAGMEEDSARVEAIEALMETWVASNPRQAADWAGSLPAGRFRDDALSALMVHWAARSPADAAAWMSRTGVDDGEAASVLAGIWATSHPGAAAGWATSMTNLESRRLATSSVVSVWAATAPQAAATFANNLPASDRPAAITAVLAAWGVTAPAAAAAWLKQVSFDSEADQATAIAALVTPWTSQSPGAVSKYINTLPEGPAREAAASQFAVTAAATAPAEALMWAMNLNDPDQRNQVVADACEAWFEGSPDTFRTGIIEAIGLMEDPAMRRGVYEMLYDRDPAFQENLLQLVDQAPQISAGTPPVPAPVPAPAAVTAPAAVVPQAPPVPEPPAQLFPEEPPPLPDPDYPMN